MTRSTSSPYGEAREQGKKIVGSMQAISDPQRNFYKEENGHVSDLEMVLKLSYVKLFISR